MGIFREVTFRWAETILIFGNLDPWKATSFVLLKVDVPGEVINKTFHLHEMSFGGFTFQLR